MRDVAHEKFDRDGQQDDTEKFPQYIDASGSENFADEVDISQYCVDDDQVQYQSQDDIERVVFCFQRQQRGERARPGNQRENNRYDCGASSGGVEFENLHPENHFYRNHKDDQRTCDRKRRDIHIEKA